MALRQLSISLATTVALALLATTPRLAAAEPLSSSGELLDRIVVIVNDGVVLQSEIERQTANVAARLRTDGIAVPPRDVLEPQIIERLIMERIQLQRAERLGIQITDDQLNAALGTVAQRNDMSLSQLPDALAAQGVDYAQYREDIRKELQIDQLRKRDLLPRIAISREEVDEFQKRDGGKNKVDYDISHILISVPPGASVDEREEAEKRAQDIVDRVRGGEPFNQLAIAYSNGQQALEGGKIGWRNAEQLPTLFTETVVAMSAGEVSDPIPSGSGFHIVRLDETRGVETVIIKQTKARHILIIPDELVSDDDALALLTDLEQQIRDGADFAALAKQHSDDTGSAARGGDLGWTSPGTFVPEFDIQLKRLEPGEMSSPFQSPFGWHIVELLDERDKDATEEASLNEAYAAVRNRKLQQETESWLLQLRDEAYVDFRT